MIRSTDECEMSRSCHSATSSSAACRLPRSTRARPVQLLGLDRVPLVRHRARALLLPFAERLLDFAHLGALEVADLERERLDRRAERRARVHDLGVPVAGQHLRRRDRTQPEPFAHVLLDARVDVGVRARPRPTASRPRSTSRARSEALAIAAHLHRPQRELHAEGRRLGVDAVGPADHRRVAELAGPCGDRAPRAAPPRRGSRRRARVICNARAVSTTSLDVRP